MNQKKELASGRGMYSGSAHHSGPAYCIVLYCTGKCKSRSLVIKDTLPIPIQREKEDYHHQCQWFCVPSSWGRVATKGWKGRRE